MRHLDDELKLSVLRHEAVLSRKRNCLSQLLLRKVLECYHVIDANPGGIIVKDIKTILGLETVEVSKALRGLRERGYVRAEVRGRFWFYFTTGKLETFIRELDEINF